MASFLRIIQPWRWNIGLAETEVLFATNMRTGCLPLINGTATGIAWFDDIQVEEVDDIGEHLSGERGGGTSIPLSTRDGSSAHLGEP
jgi:hypothetical protein